jgi:hypothetical protein
MPSEPTPVWRSHRRRTRSGDERQAEGLAVDDEVVVAERVRAHELAGAEATRV